MTSQEEKKQPFIKVRWIICAITFLLLFSLVSTKVCLSLALVAMTDPGVGEVDPEATTMLPGNGTVTAERIINKHYLNWTQTTNDQLLEAAFFGAVISPIPSGRIAEKFGPRKLAFVLGMLASVTMLGFPLAAEWAFEAAFFLRAVQGLCIGCAFPCAHVLVSRWSLKYEKTLFASIIGAGGLLANVITHPLVGQLCASDFLGGWPAVFYVIGTFNAVASVAWLLVVFDDPEDHPFISDAEKQEIIENRSSSSEDSTKSMPWGAILTCSSVWALILSNFALGWMESLLSGQVPTFLDNVLNLSIENNGFLSAIPYTASIFSSIFFSYLADKLRAQGKYSTTALRKFFTDFGFILSSVCLVGSTYVGRNAVLVVTFIVLTKALSVSQVAGCYILHLDITPTYAGSLVGIMETSQNIASIVMNQAAAYIVGDAPSLDSWSNFFLVTAGLSIFGTHYFALLASAKLQKWDPTFQSDEKALEDDRNGDEVTPTIYDPEIIIKEVEPIV